MVLYKHLPPLAQKSDSAGGNGDEDGLSQEDDEKGTGRHHGVMHRQQWAAGVGESVYGD